MKNCLMRTNSDCGKKSAIYMFPISQANVISSIGVAGGYGRESGDYGWLWDQYWKGV